MSQDLNALTTDLIQSDILEDSHISLVVKNLNTNTYITDYQGDHLMVPASVLKLITNFSALTLLGKDSRFTTDIYYSGNIQYDSTLHGDIIIKGGGDPTLGSYKFKGVRSLDELLGLFAMEIKKAGINCIEGDIVIDDNYFDHQGAEDEWQYNDVGNYYAAGAWSLNMHENLYKLYFGPTQEKAQKTSITSIYPDIETLTFRNEVLTSDPGSGDNAYIYGGQDNYNKTIRGTIPAGKKHFMIKGALPNPGRLFGELLKDRLEKEHVHSYGIKFQSLPEDAVKVYGHASPTLERIAYISNLESNNLYSESLLKQIGKRMFSIGNSENGIKAIKRQLNSWGINQKHLKMKEGAGLSRNNFISARLMTDFLDELAKKYKKDVICRLIGQPGDQNGTLKNILSKSSHKKKFWIKTGSMDNVQSYAGYFISPSGNMYSFCILVNVFDAPHYQIRNLLDNYLDALYSNID